jgi:hypothetical protein
MDHQAETLRDGGDGSDPGTIDHVAVAGLPGSIFLVGNASIVMAALSDGWVKWATRGRLNEKFMII